jgi:hypothetical protein
MPLTGPISRTKGLSPHGLPEKVLRPLIVHSQIWPLDAAGGVAGGVCTVGIAATAGSIAGAGSGTEAGAGAGVEVAATSAGCAGAAAWLGAGNIAGAFLLVELTAIATATAASISPPVIHGRRSPALPIAGLSSEGSARAANMTELLKMRRLDHEAVEYEINRCRTSPSATWDSAIGRR